MKILMKAFLLLVVLGIFSCRDAKKEEAEAEIKIEKIDSIQQEASSLIKDVETEAQDLEAALKELDSI